MTTPEHAGPTGARPERDGGWRDILASNAETAHIEGFALEQLIDMQRDRASRPGEAR